jgi:hypothetical protein
LALPEDGSVVASGTHDPNGVAVVDIATRSGLDSFIRLGASTGEVVGDRTTPEAREAIQPVLNTAQICPLDPATAPWPYTGVPTAERTLQWGMIEYLVPDSVTGFSIGLAQATCTSGYCPPTLVVETAGSRMVVDAESGTRIDSVSDIDGVDQEAFARYADSIRLIVDGY